MIYFGKAGCTWSNRPEIPQMIQRAEARLRTVAGERGLTLVTIGVAADASSARGLSHLSEIGIEFNEVAAGNGWANTLSLQYLWERYGAPVSTPQVMVLERTLNVVRRSPALIYSVDGERLLTRAVGFYELEAWLDRDTLVPKFEVASLAPGFASTSLPEGGEK